VIGSGAVELLELVVELLGVELLLAGAELAPLEVVWLVPLLLVPGVELEAAVVPHPAKPRAITEARSMNFGVLFIFFSFFYLFLSSIDTDFG
jgi:hypothetical protein